MNLAQAARAIQRELQKANPGAIWAVLGWQKNPRRELLAGISDKQSTLILDGQSDRYVYEDREQEWANTPYAFGTIWNFGGHTTMGANRCRIPAKRWTTPSSIRVCRIGAGENSRPGYCRPHVWLGDFACSAQRERRLMERRALLRNAAGFGLAGGLFGNGWRRSALAQAGSGSARIAQTGDGSDLHPELTRRIAALEKRGRGTVELEDGVYELSQPLRLPLSVSLVMTPNAVLRARSGFACDAVLVLPIISPSHK